MLYPKTKRKKNKFKSFMSKVKDDMKNIFYDIIYLIKSKDYFMIFMKKNFHIKRLYLQREEVHQEGEYQILMVIFWWIIKL